jgi:hypothetical protein
MAYEVNRIEPKMPVHGYQTFGIVAPTSTHWQAATCAEVECAAHVNGWDTHVDESTPLGQRQAHYIRKEARRAYSESKRPDGLTTFSFKAGQTCFRQHRKRIEREELFVRRNGDHRGSPDGVRRTYDRPDQWVDDFATHQEEIARLNQRG